MVKQLSRIKIMTLRRLRGWGVREDYIIIIAIINMVMMIIMNSIMGSSRNLGLNMLLLERLKGNLLNNKNRIKINFSE